MLGVRSEWPHAARLEVGAIGLIHLQVEHIIGDQGEKAIARVDADAAEHAPGADTRDHAAQLVADEGSEARPDWHKTRPAGVWRAPSGNWTYPSSGVCTASYDCLLSTSLETPAAPPTHVPPGGTSSPTPPAAPPSPLPRPHRARAECAPRRDGAARDP